jgi:hypothetical protein
MSGRRKSVGFGFIPEESGHHFLVTIPAARSEKVLISENFTWEESQELRNLSFALGNEDDKMRVILPRGKWQAIAGEVQAVFNQRLKRNNLSVGRWKIGQTPVSRLLGKELVLLAWAIEDADPALIPVAIKNWLGLAPEERWWLFTMTNAATGHAIYGRDKGWRKAVRFALTENPVTGDQQHESRQELFLIMEEALSWARQREAGLIKDWGEKDSNDEIIY